MAADNDSGVICVIIGVISPSFQIGETEVQGQQVACPGKELAQDLNPGFVLLDLCWLLLGNESLFSVLPFYLLCAPRGVSVYSFPW